MNSRTRFVVPLLLLFPVSVPAAGPGLEGTWKFIPAKSTDIASWNYSLPQLEISSSPGAVRVIHNWLDRGKVAYADTFAFSPGGTASASVTRSEVWPENWYMGVLSSAGDPCTVSGVWIQPGSSLRVTPRETLSSDRSVFRLSRFRGVTSCQS